MANSYKDRFDKLDQQLEKLDSRLDNIDVTLARQNVSLETHIKRTELLEEALVPLKAHMNQIMGAGKLIGIVALLTTIIATILKFKS